MRDASSSRCSAARRRRGRSRRARSRRERMRRIGVLMNLAADDPEATGPHRGVPCRGCSNWAGPTAATCGSTIAGARAMPTAIRRYAAELVALAPDVILAAGALGVAAVAAGDPHRADRVRECHRSGRRRLRREPGAAGRQRHRLYAVRIRHRAGNGWNCSRRSRRA